MINLYMSAYTASFMHSGKHPKKLGLLRIPALFTCVASFGCQIWQPKNGLGGKGLYSLAGRCNTTGYNKDLPEFPFCPYNSVLIMKKKKEKNQTNQTKIPKCTKSNKTKPKHSRALIMSAILLFAERGIIQRILIHFSE